MPSFCPRLPTALLFLWNTSLFYQFYLSHHSLSSCALYFYLYQPQNLFTCRTFILCYSQSLKNMISFPLTEVFFKCVSFWTTLLIKTGCICILWLEQVVYTMLVMHPELLVWTSKVIFQFCRNRQIFLSGIYITFYTLNIHFSSMKHCLKYDQEKTQTPRIRIFQKFHWKDP